MHMRKVRILRCKCHGTVREISHISSDNYGESRENTENEEIDKMLEIIENTLKTR